MSELTQRPGSDALDLIFEPCTEDGEGFLHLWLGNTRMGKTFANRHVVNAALLRKHVDHVFTVDDKNPSKVQYEAEIYRKNPAHLVSSPPLLRDNDPKHISFRGIAYECNLADVCNHGDVASMVWKIKYSKPQLRLLLNLDELADATNGEQHWLDDKNAQIYRKGAGVGISTTATTQLPQLLPREAFGLSQSIGLFQTDTRELDYLLSKRFLPAEIAETVQRLDRGDFLLYKRGKGMMPHVYRF